VNNSAESHSQTLTKRRTSPPSSAITHARLPRKKSSLKVSLVQPLTKFIFIPIFFWGTP